MKLPAERRGRRSRARRGPDEPHSIHMPSPSYWPLVLALGLPIMGYGFVFKNWWLLADRASWSRSSGSAAGRSNRRPSPTTGGGALMAQAVVTAGSAERRPAHGTTTRHDTNTGVSNTKLAIWLFLSSEALFFGAFIATYFLYRGRDAQFLKGPTPDELLNIPFTSVTSFVLLMSSLTMVLALAAIQRGDHRRLRIWLLATVLFGADVHRRPGLRVHRVLPRGPAPRHQHVRHDVLRPHRPARRARHGRHHLAALAVGPFDAGPARAGAGARRSRSPASTGTSSTSCGSSSSPRST